MIHPWVLLRRTNIPDRSDKRGGKNIKTKEEKKKKDWWGKKKQKCVDRTYPTHSHCVQEKKENIPLASWGSSTRRSILPAVDVTQRWWLSWDVARCLKSCWEGRGRAGISGSLKTRTEEKSEAHRRAGKYRDTYQLHGNTEMGMTF